MAKNTFWIIISVMLLASAGFGLAYNQYSNYLDNEEQTNYYFVEFMPDRIDSDGKYEPAQTTFSKRGYFPNDSAAVERYRDEENKRISGFEKELKVAKEKYASKRHTNNELDVVDKVNLDAVTKLYNKEMSKQHFVVRLTYTRKFSVLAFEDLLKSSASNSSSYLNSLKSYCSSDPSTGAIGAKLAYYYIE